MTLNNCPEPSQVHNFYSFFLNLLLIFFASAFRNWIRQWSYRTFCVVHKVKCWLSWLRFSKSGTLPILASASRAKSWCVTRKRESFFVQAKWRTHQKGIKLVLFQNKLWISLPQSHLISATPIKGYFNFLLDLWCDKTPMDWVLYFDRRSKSQSWVHAFLSSVWRVGLMVPQYQKQIFMSSWLLCEGRDSYRIFITSGQNIVPVVEAFLPPLFKFNRACILKTALSKGPNHLCVQIH